MYYNTRYTVIHHIIIHYNILYYTRLSYPILYYNITQYGKQLVFFGPASGQDSIFEGCKLHTSPAVGRWDKRGDRERGLGKVGQDEKSGTNGGIGKGKWDERETHDATTKPTNVTT